MAIPILWVYLAQAGPNIGSMFTIFWKLTNTEGRLYMLPNGTDCRNLLFNASCQLANTEYILS